MLKGTAFHDMSLKIDFTSEKKRNKKTVARGHEHVLRRGQSLSAGYLFKDNTCHSRS